MLIVTPFTFGFLAAFLGSILPGLLNMTIAKINLKEGFYNAFSFTIGAVFIFACQVYISLVFARFICSHPDVVILLREVGFGIFTALSIYFLGIAQKPKIKEADLKTNSKKNRFFMGMLLSGLNFFPIPFFAFLGVTLASYHLINFNFNTLSIFISGVIGGAFGGFYLYIKLSQKIEHKTNILLSNMNIIIGSITGLIALGTLVNIIMYYW